MSPSCGTSRRSVLTAVHWPTTTDAAQRETHAYLLTRQVITLLQRTQLQVVITCQAWHAKNMRHHILGAPAAAAAAARPTLTPGRVQISWT